MLEVLLKLRAIGATASEIPYTLRHPPQAGREQNPHLSYLPPSSPSSVTASRFRKMCSPQ